MTIRNRLNDILLKSRYRLDRISLLEQVLIQKYGREEPFTFLQIGANDGISFDNLFQLVTSRNCRGVVVEPVPFYFKQLESLYSAFETIVPVNLAIHAAEKNNHIYCVDPAQTASLPKWVSGVASFNRGHLQQFDIPDKAILEVEIECIQLMQLIEQYGLDTLDLIQIDTEGYDAEVIAMIDFDRIRPSIIKFEHAHLTDKEIQSTHKILALGFSTSARLSVFASLVKSSLILSFKTSSLSNIILFS